MKSTRHRSKQSSSLPAVLFDLDGTLIDSVYEHVTAWSLALRSEGIKLPNWKIHRHIGMSSSSFIKELLRETASNRRRLKIGDMDQKHDAEFEEMRLELLPGAQNLLNHSSRWASRGPSQLLAESGRQSGCCDALKFQNAFRW